MQTFDEKKLRRALKCRRIISYVSDSFMFIVLGCLFILFLAYLIVSLESIVTNPAYATAALAIATVALAIIAVISIAFQAFVERKRNRIRYLEQVIEEVYNPLLSYFKENPNMNFDQDSILSARRDIDRIIFNKRFLLEPPKGVVKNFNGYFQRYKDGDKMNYSGWAFKLDKDVKYWRGFGSILYYYYKEHVNQYRTYMNLEKLKWEKPNWNKVFYLDEVKDPKYIIE